MVGDGAGGDGTTVDNDEFPRDGFGDHFEGMGGDEGRVDEV